MKAISANLKFISGITRPLPENQYRDLYGEADRQRGRMASDGSATMKNERAGLSRLSALLFVGIAHYRKLSFMKLAAIADIEARTPSKRVLTSTPSGRLALQRSCETECRSARPPMEVPIPIYCKSFFSSFSTAAANRSATILKISLLSSIGKCCQKFIRFSKNGSSK